MATILNTDPTKLKNTGNIYCAVQTGFKMASSEFSLEKLNSKEPQLLIYW